MTGTKSPEAMLLDLTDIHEGQVWSEGAVFSEDVLQAFIDLSGDRALHHVDDDHAGEMGYRAKIVHAFLVALPFSKMLGMCLPGSNTVIHQIQFDALAPVYVGDELTYEVKVHRVSASVKTVVLRLAVINQENETVQRGRATCAFRR